MIASTPSLGGYVSVDVETAGPAPSLYSLLAIGACLIDDPAQAFYVELQPITMRALPEALAVSGLSLANLAAHGRTPIGAMSAFAAWLEAVIPRPQKPVFVALNAPFDWMFVNDYFHRFLGHNPFGHTALDIKAFFMGVTGADWHETSLRAMRARYADIAPLTHHAVRDAQHQARLFRRVYNDAHA